MANIKSAEKRIRQAAQRTRRNRSARSRLRGAVKKYRLTGDKEKPANLPGAYSEIDRALKRGIIHRKAAARYKSRLAKKAAAK
jgi:small subunit ribosomal protein S20